MGVAGEFGSLRHLAERFFGPTPAGPPAEEEAWARAQLLPGEVALWERMSGPDRRHAVGVAHDAIGLLDDQGPPPAREVVASALLHDVGKVESGLGTFARVGVTLAAIAVGRERLAADRGRPSRTRLYLTHDRVGADLLRHAGSDALTVAWAEEHHLDPVRWSVPARVGQALKQADGD